MTGKWDTVNHYFNCTEQSLSLLSMNLIIELIFEINILSRDGWRAGTSQEIKISIFI